MIMFGIGSAAFVFAPLIGQRRQRLFLQQQQQVVEKMKEERLITQEQIDKEAEAERERFSVRESN
jgi:hypothetical protein